MTNTLKRVNTRVVVNPHMSNGFSHHYHLVGSTFFLGGVRCDFSFLSHFSMKFLYANRIAPAGTPRSAAAHLGLYCLPMSHKKDHRLKHLMNIDVIKRVIMYFYIFLSSL